MSVLPTPDGEEPAVLQRLLERPAPFTGREALEEGASYVWLRRWCALGLLQHPIRGVYHAPELTDGLPLRLAVLRLVVPPDWVVTDRTAGWLWGADMVLAPNDHLRTPAVHVFSPPGHRLRNGLVTSGERRLPSGDVAELDGLRVTTPLRTPATSGGCSTGTRPSPRSTPWRHSGGSPPTSWPPRQCGSAAIAAWCS